MSTAQTHRTALCIPLVVMLLDRSGLTSNTSPATHETSAPIDPDYCVTVPQLSLRKIFQWCKLV